jgi:hypothetical protein
VVNVQQVRAGLEVKLNDTMENFVGSPHSDKIFADALSVARNVDGGAHDARPPGDQLTFDGRNEFVDAYKSGGVGTVTAFGYGTLTFIRVEKLSVVNTLGSTGFGGYDVSAYTAVTNYPLIGGAGGPQAIAAGDVNNDGWNDMVVVNYWGANNINVYLGDGDGTFTPAGAFPSGGTGAICVALADVNADANRDIIVLNSLSNNVSVLLGNGAGAFAADFGTPYVTDPGNRFGTAPRSLAVEDINADGSPDILVANSWSGSVSILQNLNNWVLPAKHFTENAATMLITRPYRNATDVRTLDYDGNGVVDAIVVSNHMSNSIEIFNNRGGGLFGAFDPTTGARMSDVQWNTGTAPVALITKDYLGRNLDFDGDGNPDFVVAGYQSNYITVFMGDGLGNFIQQVQTGYYLQSPTTIVAGDVNSDGKTDLLWTNWDRQISTALAVGNGVFSKPYVTYLDIGQTSFFEPRGVVLSDFNNDGGIDIALANYGSNMVSVMLRNLVI